MAKYRGKDSIGTVVAIGGGVIGGGWAAAFLGSGRRVQLHDPAPGAAPRVRRHVEQAWPQMVALGLARKDDCWAERLTFHDCLEAALDGAEFVQESTPECADLKRSLFARLDKLVPADVLIGSSTSSLPISEMQAGLGSAARFVLGHPFNPVHLLPLVEVAGGSDTDPEAVDQAFAFYASLGKEPIRLNREIFGHIGNRLASAMFREAVRLVAEGYASVKDVDNAIRFGPALKWAIQGQFTTFHTSGGREGLAGFLPKFASGIQKRWETMADPPLDSEELQAELIRQMEEATAGRTVEQIAQRQDQLVMDMLAVLARDQAA